MKRLVFLFFVLVTTTVFGKSSKKDVVITIETSFGKMGFILYEDTPLHRENFLKLAKSGFYDSTTFHRIIQNFMIQGGDPNSKDLDENNDGMGGPGYTVPAEIKHSHIFGALSAARMGDYTNPTKASSGSQFYIVENKQGTPHLDGAYTVFGQLIFGGEVVHKIAEQAKNNRDRPLENIYMKVSVKELSKKKITKLYGFKYS